MTSEIEHFSKIVDALYGQTGLPDDWSTFLDDMTRFVGGEAGSFMVGYPITTEQPRCALTQRPIEVLNTYLEKFAANDPRLPVLMSRIGQVFRDFEIEPDGFETSELTQTIFNPFDIRRHTGSIIARDGDVFAFIVMMRSRQAGQFSHEECHRLSLLIPHLARSFLLHREMGRRNALTESLKAFQATLADAVILVDRSGRVVYANPAAEILMGEPDKVLLVRRGRLGCSRPDDEQALLGHISNAASAAKGAAALAPKAAVSLRRSGDKPPLRLLVCPLAQAHPWQTSAGVQAQVALIEMASGHIFATDEARSVLKSAFRLTEAEARLAALLAEGISVEQATAVLGIGRNTAKTQLQAIFHKVLPVTAIPNTYRQPALARILRDCFSVALR